MHLPVIFNTQDIFSYMYTVKPVLRDHCHETSLEGPVIRSWQNVLSFMNWTSHQRTPVLREHIFILNLSRRLSREVLLYYIRLPPDLCSTWTNHCQHCHSHGVVIQACGGHSLKQITEFWLHLTDSLETNSNSTHTSIKTQSYKLFQLLKYMHNDQLIHGG